VALDEIAAQCGAKDVNTVAAMPFGGVDNRPFLSWIDESGQPSELDVYFLDANDYQDVIPAQSA
jgi:hypothetical protein